MMAQLQLAVSADELWQITQSLYDAAKTAPLVEADKRWSFEWTFDEYEDVIRRFEAVLEAVEAEQEGEGTA